MKLKTVMLSVGEDHLTDGNVGLVTSCSVYLALESMLNLPESLFRPMAVWKHVVVYENADFDSVHVSNSKRLSEFIWRIDKGKHVSPTSFRVQVPEEWIKD